MKLDTGVQTGGASQGRHLELVDEGKVERGMTCVKVLRVSIKTGTLFPTPLDNSTRTQSLDEGGSRGGTKFTGRTRISQDRHLPEAFAPLKLATQVRECVKIEERKGDGDSM